MYLSLCRLGYQQTERLSSLPIVTCGIIQFMCVSRYVYMYVFMWVYTVYSCICMHVHVCMCVDANPDCLAVSIFPLTVLCITFVNHLVMPIGLSSSLY